MGDYYPLSIRKEIVNKKYMEVFNKIVELNFWFAGDVPIHGRLFESYWILDQFNQEHLPMLYLSKITNPD